MDETTRLTQLFESTLAKLERAFRILERRVPPPMRVDFTHTFAFRHREKTIEQAIVQKLARQLSGLHAIDVLHRRGLFQEQGIVQRTLDEIKEDVIFLSLAIIRNEITDRHKQYLEYFYAEEWADPADVVGSHRSRGMVKRDKIRAYVNDAVPDGQVGRANVVARVITKAYSGFVHAASPHIMDMVWGNPPRFDVTGETGSYVSRGFDEDALNYLLRGLLSTGFAAMAFAENKLLSEMQTAAEALEHHMS